MIAADLVAPGTLEEALAILARHGADARPLAGGQSLAILLRHGLVAPAVLVDLKRIAGLDRVAVERDGGLRIGATATYRAVAADERVRAGWPVLAAAAGAVGSVHIRNRGTIGGSVAHADPTGDVTVALLALDATVEVARASGRRSVPIAALDAGPYETVLEPDELVTAIRVPPMAQGASSAFVRFSTREGEFPIAQVAVRLGWGAAGMISDARVAAGGAGDTPIRLPAVEAALVGLGTAAGPSALGAVVEAARASVEPLGDVRGSADWRRDVVLAILGRAIRRAIRDRRDAAGAVGAGAG